MNIRAPDQWPMSRQARSCLYAKTQLRNENFRNRKIKNAKNAIKIGGGGGNGVRSQYGTKPLSDCTICDLYFKNFSGEARRTPLAAGDTPPTPSPVYTIYGPLLYRYIYHDCRNADFFCKK